MSTISKNEFKKYIEDFDFTNLFNQLGWTYLHEQTPVKLEEETFIFHSVAEKSGFRIMVFIPSENHDLPDYATRIKLDRKISKLFREHLIIFCDRKKTTQIWQLFVKQIGKPSRLSETRWHKGQEPELLYQKTSNLFFTLDQEENITITDVVDLVNENFSKNAEQVTKKFYENFRKEHKKFIEFIKGISVVTDREWYASLMLNRLMFCYFIQKKGFLDNNLNYLKDKLTYCQQKKGKDRFYVSFYKNFLLALFHKGLGSPEQSEELKKEIGKIPYLNGGLFDIHELEKQYENIDICDAAFENIFNFFDQYNWHLDTRITATGRDINPDVIGYIFEKYINDRAQMGAYYTKEDITDYISKNCIIPFLFDETERTLQQAQGATKTEGIFAEIWKMLKESGDTYIYDAVKKGIVTEKLDFSTSISTDDPTHPLWSDLPAEICHGFRPDLKDKIVIADEEPHLWQIRKEWNKPAPESIALPTEIYRELIERRKRYWDIRKKIDAGEITHINDFITYNLNIRQFAQDVVDNHSDPEFIKHFYQALNNITILDPTCGSGAFLFAAMNILEPLYESCLMRMRAFVEDEDFENNKDKSSFRNRFKYFRDVLAETQNEHHPNLPYFIFKNIILRNLYGVDIMKEAVEIAKLRLFLKLVATVDADYKKPNLGLEPLPDIDFNIRYGNTLIGYATKKEIDDLQGMFVTPKMKEQILEECDLVSRTFQRFKEIQLKGYENKKEFTIAKTELNNRLDKLAENLNKILYKQHYEGMDYKRWLETHLPFHWFAEFYEIIHDKGGFDVIIGNPPYLEIRQIDYEPKGLKTFDSGAVHNMCIERSLRILRNAGNISMIVPLALVCTQRMIIVQNLLEENRNVWYSNFAWRPGKLFENVNRALTIFVANKCNQSKVFSTNYIKWISDTRDNVFPNISFIPWLEKRNSFWVPKLGNKIEENILSKLLKSDKGISYLITKQTLNRVYYRTTGGLYWKIFTNFSPKFYINGKAGKSSRETYFAVKEKGQDILCISLLSSNLFWWWYTITSNLRDLNPSDIQCFKFPSSVLNDFEIIKFGEKYLKDLEDNSTMLTRIQKQTGETQTQSFKISLSKPIIDEIDTVLAEHYGFTEEELDFIINYDIKYRMGKEIENGEEE